MTGKTGGEWPVPSEDEIDQAKEGILDALGSAPLEHFYDTEGNFGGSTFVDLSLNEPFDITAADLHALSMLSVSVGPAATRRLLGESELRTNMLQALRSVPSDLVLAKANDDDLKTAWAYHRATLEALKEPRAQRSSPWVTAAKLTARKRPLLIPVRDNLVGEVMGKSALEDGRVYWQIMKTLVTDDAVLNAIENAIDQSKERADRSGLAVVFESNPLRMIDAALWMTASGYKIAQSSD
jgi:hypothetical protein